MNDEELKRKRFVTGPVNSKLEEYNERVEDGKELGPLDPDNIPPDPILVEFQNRVKKNLTSPDDMELREKLIDAIEQVKQNGDYVAGQRSTGQYFGSRDHGGH